MMFYETTSSVVVIIALCRIWTLGLDIISHLVVTILIEYWCTYSLATENSFIYFMRQTILYLCRIWPLWCYDINFVACRNFSSQTSIFRCVLKLYYLSFFTLVLVHNWRQRFIAFPTSFKGGITLVICERVLRKTIALATGALAG